jgi:hypothetical protein
MAIDVRPLKDGYDRSHFQLQGRIAYVELLSQEIMWYMVYDADFKITKRRSGMN